MNIQEEKQYIYGMMKETTEERRRLTDIYYGLKERLDYLHKLEQRGIEDLSISGYVDLYNQTQKEIAITNLKRETEHQIQKIENHNIIEEKEKSIIPKEEIQEQIAQENKKRINKVNKEKIQSTVVSILKDAGIPLKLSELMKRVSFVLDTKISSSNFQTNIMPSLLEKNDKIERPMKGFYQYRA